MKEKLIGSLIVGAAVIFSVTYLFKLVDLITFFSL